MINDAQLLVMVSLATGPKHGHAILLDIAGFSARRLGPGTLYGAIEGLERQCLIRPREKQDRRIPYELTEAGRTILQNRLAAIETISRVGAERLRR